MFAANGRLLGVEAATISAVWWAMLALQHANRLRALQQPARIAPRRAHAPVLIALLSLGALPLAPVAVRAQAVRYGVVMDVPRARLDSAWSENPTQDERAYCVADWSSGVRHISRDQPVQDDTVFRVFGVVPAETQDATPNSVDFECAHGVPELHVHTPSTCAGDDASTCVAGGLNAFSCQPSRQDLEKLAHRGDPFAVIQCDRRVFRFYYAYEYAPASAVTLASAGASSKPDANAIPLVFRSTKKSKP